MPPDPITEGLLRHLQAHHPDPALRELARESAAGRLPLHKAIRPYADPLSALAAQATTNHKSLSPSQRAHYQNQLRAFQSPSAPPHRPPLNPDEDAWADRSIFD